MCVRVVEKERYKIYKCNANIFTIQTNRCSTKMVILHTLNVIPILYNKNVISTIIKELCDRGTGNVGLETDTRHNVDD